MTAATCCVCLRGCVPLADHEPLVVCARCDAAAEAVSDRAAFGPIAPAAAPVDVAPLFAQLRAEWDSIRDAPTPASLLLVDAARAESARVYGRLCPEKPVVRIPAVIADDLDAHVDRRRAAWITTPKRRAV